MTCAPIAVFVYNRPAHTRQTIEALQNNALAKVSDLFIFSDAPKTDLQSEAVREVRNYIRQIDGFQSLTIVERESNYGLAQSIIEGVTSLVSRHGRIVVLEDDLVVTPFFLDFMNSALDKYENAPEVIQVSGYMFPIDVTAMGDSFFLPLTTSWGWATWARAWQHLDKNIDGYRTLESDTKRRQQFDLNGAYPYFDMLTAQREGKIDSWAIRWYLGTFLAGGLTLFPKRSLVENIGFDGSGTHCHQGGHGDRIDLSFKVNTFPNSPNIASDMEIAAEVESFHRGKGRNRRKTYFSRLRKWFS